MYHFITVFSIVFTSGCVTLRANQPSSRWAVLTQVNDADCVQWPVRSKDLRIDEITFVEGRSLGFFVSGTRRDGGVFHYWAPFHWGIELDPNNFVNLPIGRSSVIAGGGVIDNTPFVSLFANGARSSEFQVRTLKNSVVKLKQAIRQKDIKEAWSVNSGKQSWIVFRKEDNDTYVNLLETDPEVVLLPISGALFKEVPFVLPSKNPSQALTFRLENNQIIMRYLDTNQDVNNKDIHLELNLEYDLESWVIRGVDDQIFLSYVEGDSLIGSAKLNVSRVDFSNQKLLLNRFPAITLGDVHVSEPALAATAKGVSVLLMQWVDGESTIARFPVAHGKLGNPIYSGIFPKGGRIMFVASDQKREELFVVVRHKNNDGWDYRLCEL